MTERRYLKSVGGKTPPSELRELSGSIEEKTKRLVAANRCFRELVKTFDGFNMSPTRKAIAANEATRRHTGIDMLDQLGVGPEELSNDVFGDRLVARNDDDWTKRVSEWLNSKAAIDRSELSVQEVLESAIGWTSEHPEYKNGESRIGKLLKQLGWRKYRAWNGGVRRNLHRRPLMKLGAVSEE